MAKITDAKQKKMERRIAQQDEYEKLSVQTDEERRAEEAAMEAELSKINKEIEETKKIEEAALKAEEEAKKAEEAVKKAEEAKRAEEAAKKAEEEAKKAEEAAAIQAQTDTPTAAQLNAEAERLSKLIADTEKKFEEVKARKLAQIANLQAEAKKAEEEAKKAEEAKRAEEAAKKAEEAKKMSERLDLVGNAQKMANAMNVINASRPTMVRSGLNGPAKIYQYWDSGLGRYIRTSDVFAAQQKAPGRWTGIWVMYENGKISHELSSDEIEKYLPV